MREDIIQRAFAEGQVAHPRVKLAYQHFVSSYGQLLAESAEHGWQVRSAELFLACACAHGDAGALAVLDREVLPAAAEAIRRTNDNAEFVEETLAQIRAKLLDASAPKIADYSGNGSLLAWIRVVATRFALHQLRPEKHGSDQHAELAESLVRERFDGEALIIAGRQAELFQRALGDAVRSLPSRDRNVLRMHLLGGCNVDQISRAYSVRRATAKGWLLSTKDQLFESVQGQLRVEQPEMTEEEFNTVAQLVRSQLDLTFADSGSSSSRVSSSNR